MFCVASSFQADTSLLNERADDIIGCLLGRLSLCYYDSVALFTCVFTVHNVLWLISIVLQKMSVSFLLLLVLP